ncbi:hypothetical protein GCM10025882_08080 [Acinetobacter gyllenbergii]|nr:hypothetical protein L293_2950 [Acinetobacter gyllenbergii CIP 110306 = MTCC 11365]GMA10384.1 hypothetical protein GCM10025882_08080 [Acinetobacter gyllenbergii]
MSCIEFDSLVVGSVEKKLGGVDFIKLFFMCDGFEFKKHVVVFCG